MRKGEADYEVDQFGRPVVPLSAFQERTVRGIRDNAVDVFGRPCHVAGGRKCLCDDECECDFEYSGTHEQFVD